LFKGTQLVVMGRYRTPKDAAIVLTGSVSGKKQVFEYRADASKESKLYDFVPRLWAIRKVGYVLGEIRLNGERPELRDEVISLGKKYGIVTPYTSYLVVEDVAPVAQRPFPPLPNRPFAEERRAQPWSAPNAAPREYSFEDDAVRGGANAPEKDKALARTEGLGAIAVAKKVQSMKEAETGPGAGESVRTASGRTFLYRNRGWVDSEALNGTPKQLKVKYLSEAYFALLAARPELKGALSLASSLTIVIGKDTSVVIDPNQGETKAEKVNEFIK
jgi:Ca-activated chloride channel family protein